MGILFRPKPPSDDSRTLRLILDKLNAINARLDAIEHKEELQAMDLDAILAKVTEQTTITGSVIALINELRAHQNDPVKQQQIYDAIVANSDALSAALTANTPAA